MALIDQEDWMTTLTEALTELCQDQFLSASKQAQKEVKELLVHIQLQNINQLQSGKRLVHLIQNQIAFDPSKKATNAVINEMCAAFQSTVASREFCHHLKELAGACNMQLQKANLISWLLMETLLKITLRERKITVLEESYENTIKPLSDSEMQVLRHAAGYLVRKLRKHYQSIAYVCDDFIEGEDAGEHGTFLAYTHAMVDALDRGGLIRVTDNFFLFMVQMEKIAKSVMTAPSKDLEDKMQEALSTSPRIVSLWDKVVQDHVSEEDKTTTFKVLIMNYCTLRVKSFANAYKFVISKKDNAKLQKSLRHHLE